MKQRQDRKQKVERRERRRIFSWEALHVSAGRRSLRMYCSCHVARISLQIFGSTRRTHRVKNTCRSRSQSALGFRAQPPELYSVYNVFCTLTRIRTELTTVCVVIQQAMPHCSPHYCTTLWQSLQHCCSIRTKTPSSSHDNASHANGSFRPTQHPRRNTIIRRPQ